MNTAVIALGSNIDPQANIARAVRLLTETFIVLKESQFVQTKPVGYTAQDDFLNGSVLIETEGTQEDLKKELKSLEKKLGRTTSTVKYGPRSIDLDIVVFNNRIVDDDFYERDFVKNAVLELIPDLQY